MVFDTPVLRGNGSCVCSWVHLIKQRSELTEGFHFFNSQVRLVRALFRCSPFRKKKTTSLNGEQRNPTHPHVHSIHHSCMFGSYDAKTFYEPMPSSKRQKSDYDICIGAIRHLLSSLHCSRQPNNKKQTPLEQLL